MNAPGVPVLAEKAYLAARIARIQSEYKTRTNSIIHSCAKPGAQGSVILFHYAANARVRSIMFILCMLPIDDLAHIRKVHAEMICNRTLRNIIDLIII